MGNTANRLLLADYLGGQQASAMGRNYVVNPSGFQNVNNITVSGATATRNTTTPLTAISDLSIALGNNATDTVTWALNTLDNSLKGQNCELRFDYLASSVGTNVIAQVLQGTNVANQTLALPTATTSQTVSLNVPCGDLSTATTVVIRNGTGSTGTGALKVANMTYGKATNLTQVSQASFYGSVTWAMTATSVWNVSANGTGYSSLGTNANAPTPTVVGNVFEPATKVPAIRLKNLPPGDYLFMATGQFYPGTSAGANWRFYDGTTGTADQSFNGASSNTTGSGMLMGRLSYTTAQSDVQVIIQAGFSGGTPTINNAATGGAMFSIAVYRFPTSSEQAIRIDQAAMSWSGYTTNAASWSVASATFADPTVSGTPAIVELTNRNFGTVTQAGSNYPGITFTPQRAGRYYACAVVQLTMPNVVNTPGQAQLYDGTNSIATSIQMTGQINTAPTTLCGIVVANATAAVTLRIRIASTSGTTSINNFGITGVGSIQWSIFAIDTALPAPYLVGGVSSSSAGQTRIEAASITNNGTCAVSTSTGSWITAISNTGTGRCSLTWSFASAPMCTCTVANTWGRVCAGYNSGITSTGWEVGTDQPGVGLVNLPFYITCVGPK
jgi:hypothetical protein